jgi:histone-binding protein RBBP4
MWDRRNLASGGAGSPVHKFEGHKAAVLCVQACQNNIFAVISLYADVVASYDVFGYLLAIILSFGFQWSPDRASVFGSSAEDGFLNVWDHEKVTTHIH